MPNPLSERRTCKICGAEFLPTTSNQKFCSDECKKQGNRDRVKKHYYATRHVKTVEEKIDRRIEIGVAKRKKHKDPNVSLTEIAKRAAAEHMTYGQYVMKYNI